MCTAACLPVCVPGSYSHLRVYLIQLRVTLARHSHSQPASQCIRVFVAEPHTHTHTHTEEDSFLGGLSVER